jgi:hypothetical protein
MTEIVKSQQIIDTHSHYWPEAMVSALKSGGSWHGWELTKTAKGKLAVARGNWIAPFEFDEYAGDIALRREKDMKSKKLQLSY